MRAGRSQEAADFAFHINPLYNIAYYFLKKQTIWLNIHIVLFVPKISVTMRSGSDQNITPWLPLADQCFIYIYMQVYFTMLFSQQKSVAFHRYIYLFANL